MAARPSLGEVLGAVPEHLKPKLDQKLDGDHNEVLLHLGYIAKNIPEWEGRVADNLGLSYVDVSDIKKKFTDPEQQRSLHLPVHMYCTTSHTLSLDPTNLLVR